MMEYLSKRGSGKETPFSVNNQKLGDLSPPNTGQQAVNLVGKIAIKQKQKRMIYNYNVDI